jgi:hypothetical protein
MWLRNRPGIVGAVVLVLMLALFVSPSGVAASGPPCRFFGSVKINGQPAVKGTAIKVWLQEGGNTIWEGDIETGTNPAGDPIPDDIYLLDVPAADPPTPGAEEGDIVYFSVEGIPAQTDTWVPGGFREHDLSVTNPTEPTIAFGPSGLSFSAIEGGANPTSQVMGIWNSGPGTLGWGVSDNADWLTLSPTSGSSTGEHDEVTASVNTAGMSAGDYSATITIAAAGAINTPRTFSVSLTITETAVPTIAFGPASLSFSAVAGKANPANQTLEIWNSGTGSLNWSVSDNADWLRLSPATGSSSGEHDEVTASVNTAGMSAGNYSATITIAAAGATNTPRTLSVSLPLTETAVPTIAFSPASLSFSAVAGEANPPNQTLEIWNSGTGTLDWSVSDDAAWLTLAPTNGSSTGEHDVVTASVDIADMTAGDYSATVTVAAAGATDTAQTLAVSLTLTETEAPISPIDTLRVMAPWIAGGAAIIAGIILLVRRRRRDMKWGT